MKKLFTLVFCFLGFIASASHIAGAELTYTHISGNDYHLKLKIYRDCSGISMSSSEIININSVSLSQSFSATINQTGNGILSAFCPSIQTTCTNPMSIYPGYEFGIYEGNVTLPGAAADWQFYYSSCCRNASITNLTNAASDGVCVIADLDNSSAAGGLNSSAQMMLNNVLVLHTNQTYLFSQAAVDPDGDSLDYQLVTPMSDNLQACTFQIGYSAASPLGSGGSISLNAATGALTMNNTMAGVTVLAYKIDEYRNGLKVGTVRKDLQIVWTNGGTNNLPTLSGVNGGTNYYTSINVCPGASLSFTMQATDADVADSVFVSMNNNNIPGSTLTSNGAQQPLMTFSWTPTIADINPQPYILGFDVKDNHCDLLGTQQYGFLIYVNNCNVDTVWPGDANADYVVDNYDVLNIGLGNNTTGIARPGANLTWTAQYCNDWINAFNSGVNYKHADCDGNGTINSSDLTAVSTNYGQFHLKTNNPGQYKTAGLPDLYFDTNGISAISGNTIQIPVMLGSSSAMMNNIYGLAGHVQVTNTLSGPLQLSNTNSWIGNTSNSFLFQKNINTNDLAFTLVRNDQQNVNGQGQIATLSLPISASAIQGSAIELRFTDVKLIKNDGLEISDFNVVADTLYVQSPNGITQNTQSTIMNLYPNPVTDLLSIDYHGQTQNPCTIIITDAFGRIVYQQSLTMNAAGTHSVDMKSFARGMYTLKLISADKQFVQKVMKR
ncbi:MAG: T9SS type A sorting domain-containing protein [Chitinophagaceae bacterium]|nr:T9SS type A sorting domain-containing protein [Chitinophagaceae bacterium]